MAFYNSNLDPKEIEEIKREKEEEQEQFIQKQYEKGVIPDYSKKSNKIFNGNVKGKNHTKVFKKAKEDQEKEKDNDKKTYTINKYSQGIPLAESTLIDNIPYFIQIIDDKPILKQKIELSDIDLVPPERTEYLSKEYSFASLDEINYFFNLAKQETLDSIFQRNKSLLKKYIDVEEDFINLCAGDLIFTYFQDKMGMCHYLLIVGDNNTGKSNILLLFSILGYRALYDTSITPANIYNFCGQLEEGQGIIMEDEIDDIDFQDEKKKLYKVSYRSGTKVTRMYDNINSSGSNKKSSRQQAFLLYCFKVFASEKLPDKVKSKGFLERIIPLKSVSGDPQFDISEIVNDAGDEQFKELYEELINTRKLLLIYRLLHHNDAIPNVELNIKNRYKQLTKPLIRLFQNSESLDEIIKSLSKYVIEKNEEKINSLDSALLFLVIDLVAKKEGTTILYNDEIWEKVKKEFKGNEIEDKPYSYYSEDYGLISKTKITNICETKFSGKQHKDPLNGRGLIFNQDTLNKLSANYSIINGIKIIKEIKEEEEESNPKNVYDTYDTYDTSIDSPDTNSKDSITNNANNMTDQTPDQEKRIPKMYDKTAKNDTDIDTKTSGHSLQVSKVSQVSYNRFNNTLISEQDLKDPYGYQYDPEIINNIEKFDNSDRWFCYKCNIKDDKWGMMKHICKHDKKKSTNKNKVIDSKIESSKNRYSLGE